MARVFLLAILVGLAGSPTAFAAGGPLATAVSDPDTRVPSSEASLAFTRARSAGTAFVRLGLDWSAVGGLRPADASNPGDPAYRWASFDRQVRLALANRLQPIVLINGAPGWAWGGKQSRGGDGAVRPSPKEFGRFAGAAAKRFNGLSPGLPRIRYWQAWGEPNININLAPQFVRGRSFSPGWYRAMLNAFATAVHRVSRDNVVVAGGLAPFTINTQSAISIAPMRFMRELLCLSKGRRPKRTCPQRAQFDVWAHHPYTSGGPRHHAASPDDVSLGDLPEMKRLLDAAVRLGKVVSRQKMRFWVTEFSWDSKPPDPHPRTVPTVLHGRWVAEALHQMWRSGVSLAVWYQLRDEPYEDSPFQGGLYFRGGASLQRDQAKPALQAFRFPFTAYRERGRISVWGRTPFGRRGVIAIEQGSGSRWRRIATLRANRHGIFAGGLSSAPGPRRSARRAGSARIPYRQTILGDRPFAYWRLGESSGPTARDERGGADGRYEGGVKLGVAGALVGDPNRGASLDGRNDKVGLPALPAAKTAEVWLKTTATTTAAAFSNRDAANRNTFLGVVTAGAAFVYDTAALLGSRWVSDGAWHHLVYTHDGSLGRLYVDGALDGTSLFARLAQDAPASLGYDAALRNFFRGSIDEVALYDYPLSSVQVKRHFEASGRKVSSRQQFRVSGPPPYIRARIADGSSSSLPFSLTRQPDRFVLPFGGGGK